MLSVGKSPVVGNQTGKKSMIFVIFDHCYGADLFLFIQHICFLDMQLRYTLRLIILCVFIASLLILLLHHGLNNHLSHEALEEPSSTDVELTGSQTAVLYEPGYKNSLLGRVCPNRGISVHLLIMVFSPVKDFGNRNNIRMTYGMFRERRELSLVFVLLSTTDPYINKMVEDEQDDYGDLIRGNSIDSPDNATLKSLFMLEWIKDNCIMANFVLKVDDDMYVNVPLLLDRVDSFDRRNKYMYGSVKYNSRVVREFVPTQQYSGTVWPPYLDGSAFIFPAYMASYVFKAAMEYPYFHSEFIFLTGFVAPSINIGLVNIDDMVLKGQHTICDALLALTVQQTDLESMLSLQKALIIGRKECQE